MFTRAIWNTFDVSASKKTASSSAGIRKDIILYILQMMHMYVSSILTTKGNVDRRTSAFDHKCYFASAQYTPFHFINKGGV